jgi:hypothetical protein
MNWHNRMPDANDLGLIPMVIEQSGRGFLPGYPLTATGTHRPRHLGGRPAPL